MLRTYVQALVVIVIGLLIGGLTAQYSIQRSHGFGAINIGQWTAWPFVGGVEVDPYTAAKVAADGTIPLGAAEGLTFEALTDAAGDTLRLQCEYRVEGMTPAARLWTMAAYHLDGKAVETRQAGVAATNSYLVVRFADSSFAITLGESPRAGNWLTLGGEGPFKLVLRLYDTPITSGAGLINPVMPGIRNLGCRK